eukprot:124365-Pelagomonas_calceolata.AAC.2
MGIWRVLGSTRLHNLASLIDAGRVFSAYVAFFSFSTLAKRPRALRKGSLTSCCLKVRKCKTGQLIRAFQGLHSCKILEQPAVPEDCETWSLFQSRI